MAQYSGAVVKWNAQQSSRYQDSSLILLFMMMKSGLSRPPECRDSSLYITPSAKDEENQLLYFIQSESTGYLGNIILVFRQGGLKSFAVGEYALPWHLEEKNRSLFLNPHGAAKRVLNTSHQRSHLHAAFILSARKNRFLKCRDFYTMEKNDNIMEHVMLSRLPIYAIEGNTLSRSLVRNIRNRSPELFNTEHKVSRTGDLVELPSPRMHMLPLGGENRSFFLSALTYQKRGRLLYLNPQNSKRALSTARNQQQKRVFSINIQTRLSRPLRRRSRLFHIEPAMFRSSDLESQHTLSWCLEREHNGIMQSAICIGYQDAVAKLLSPNSQVQCSRSPRRRNMPPHTEPAAMFRPSNLKTQHTSSWCLESVTQPAKHNVVGYQDTVAKLLSKHLSRSLKRRSGLFHVEHAMFRQSYLDSRHTLSWCTELLLSSNLIEYPQIRLTRRRSRPPQLFNTYMFKSSDLQTQHTLSSCLEEYSGVLQSAMCIGYQECALLLSNSNSIGIYETQRSSKSLRRNKPPQLLHTVFRPSNHQSQHTLPRLAMRITDVAKVHNYNAVDTLMQHSLSYTRRNRSLPQLSHTEVFRPGDNLNSPSPGEHSLPSSVQSFVAQCGGDLEEEYDQELSNSGVIAVQESGTQLPTRSLLIVTKYQLPEEIQKCAVFLGSAKAREESKEVNVDHDDLGCTEDTAGGDSSGRVTVKAVLQESPDTENAPYLESPQSLLFPVLKCFT